MSLWVILCLFGHFALLWCHVVSLCGCFSFFFKVSLYLCIFLASHCGFVSLCNCFVVFCNLAICIFASLHGQCVLIYVAICRWRPLMTLCTTGLWQCSVIHRWLHTKLEIGSALGLKQLRGRATCDVLPVKQFSVFCHKVFPSVRFIIRFILSRSEKQRSVKLCVYWEICFIVSHSALFWRHFTVYVAFHPQFIFFGAMLRLCSLSSAAKWRKKWKQIWWLMSSCQCLSKRGDGEMDGGMDA